jgi:late competence protein required for DNA uptake (superfamily II DNA/RNA helicase)
MNLQTLNDAKGYIKSKQAFNIADSFDLSKFCVRLLKSKEREHWGREIAIRVLDNIGKFPKETAELWNDVIEISGLYPYVNPNLLDDSALFRYEYHKSRTLFKDGEAVYLHEEQQEISEQLQYGNSVILSAPTSFGKSLLIEELISTEKYRNIVIIQPTLALLDETRKKLNRYKDIYNVVVSTSQLPKDNTKNIFLFTGERVVEYQNFPKIDFFIIDEFYKLSISRDDDRAVTLNQAFHKLLKQTNRFYLLGPVIKSIPISFQEKLNIGIRYTNFSTVAIDEVPVITTPKATQEERKTVLFKLLSSLEEPTLIYCSAPEKTTMIADEFANFIKSDKNYKTANKDLIEWIDENINNKWSLINCLSKGVSFHNGILPRHLGSSIVDAFNTGSIKYLFCTATLIEGVNTTAKNIVLFDNTKGNKIPIDFFDYKNIAGRSGRMKIHYTGNIYKFYDTPPQLELEVDIPFITQINAPNELLIQLDENELTKESKEKMKIYENIDNDLMDVVKSNNNILIEGQLSLVKEIESNLKLYNSLLTWNGFPKYNELVPVLELAWKHLLRKNETKANVRSARQLATYTIQYSIYKSVKGVIDNQVNTQFWLNEIPEEQARINKVTFNVLNAMRHWFDYKLPKWLSTVSKLQEYVFKRHNLKFGDYNAFASALENGFIFSTLTTLLEYDIPMSAINKLQRTFRRDDSFENILAQLKQLNLDRTRLNNYEKKKIKQIL